MKYGETVDAAKAVRKYFGLDGSGTEDKTVKEWLEMTKPRCLVMLLIDAMGSSVLRKYLKEDDFFIRNTVKNITSVFPPTTAASVISLCTGKYPCETAWLGWNQYFPEMDDNIIMFLGKSMYGTKQYGKYPLERLPAEYMHETLIRKGIKADSVWPRWGEVHPSETIEELADNVLKLTEDQDMRFIYAYWDEFDSLMHQNGPSSEIVGQELRHIQDTAERLSNSLPADCALMIIADHSQIDISCIDLEEDRELSEMLEGEPALEPRAMSFRVKKECLNSFREVFLRHYGDIYTLYSRDEVIQNKLFGEGKENPDFPAFIGDYLAVARTPASLWWKKKKAKGGHAGGTREEAYVPLILIPYVDSQQTLI